MLILICINNTLSFNFIVIIIINLKDHRLNSGSDSRPIIGSDFGVNITSQYRPAIIIQASIDHRSNIDSQHCELGPIIGPTIFSYMGYFDTRGQNGRFTRGVSDLHGLMYRTIFFFTHACETRIGSPFTDIENAP